MTNSFNEAFYKIGWAAITMVVVYTGTQVKEMSTSISQLNMNVAVIVEKVAQGSENQKTLAVKIDYSEQRIRQLETSLKELQAQTGRKHSNF